MGHWFRLRAVTLLRRCHAVRWSRPHAPNAAPPSGRVCTLLAGRIDTGPMNTSSTSTSRQQPLAALARANHVRMVRVELKRRVRAGELTAGEAILRGSRDTDTMTVMELLLSQRGLGPVRAAKVVRSISLSERKTLGSLTARQRLTLAAVLVRDSRSPPTACG